MLGPNDTYAVAQLFAPIKLTLARERQGLTRSHLASVVGKTPSAVSQFESGASRPDPKTIASLALALGIPVQFFAQNLIATPISPKDCHFRSLRSASQRSRRMLLATGTLISEVVTRLEEYLTLPEVNTLTPDSPIETSEDIENHAVDLRRSWGLGLGPISNMTKLLQANGIIPYPISTEAEDVDAFSYWHFGRPFVFLVSTKGSTSRTRFDAAHELGHLTMHSDAMPGNLELERHANRFGAAFLMPRESFGRECPNRFVMEHFAELKQRWKVSISAMVRRSYELGKLSHSSYRRAHTYLNRTNQRIDEPFEPKAEPPDLLSDATGMLSERQQADIAAHMGLRLEHLQGLIGLN